ncbi:signal transduction protein [Aliiroseovarius sp. S1339]|uniref:EF-hand domain-containing protein n=1 Tax=Aliiroseovarius sp. S1339 TaxID=2936990 RepID=UPI0020BFB9B3|nr:signal transduction protein [Aliiroseovarius sp. S1339]MCK8464587.1 signal transduction protein [Aliiroseovarius sp. S1339]
MRTTFTTSLLIGALAAPVGAIAQSSEGGDLAKLAFQSVDTAERGYIDQGEFSNFGGDVFVSMDNDQNNKLSLGEFLSWGFGLEQVAEDAGRAEAFETAMRVVFAFWDRDGDNEITRTEHRQSLMSDFRRADANNDAVLTEEEFLLGFSVNVAARAAINPPPAE